MQNHHRVGRRPKPAGSTWTEKQWEAITCRGGNVLVTAGAGSGKTSVLVERILQRIMDREEPLEIDRLLVVTFTNAAAAEMKQRIGAALEKALQENPRLSFLRRQLLLLNKASISTVHSFCLQVIKRYYYLRDLDPSFRMLEETEADLLQQEVLEEVLEGYYANEEVESPFYRLVDIYSSDRGDRALSELVLRLYNFSRSHLQPDQWLLQQASAFALEDAGELERTPWVKEMLLYCRQELAGMRRRLQEALALAASPGGPAPYIANLQEELVTLQQIATAAQHSWAELLAAMQLVSFGRLKPCSGEGYNQFLKESVQQRRNECKKGLQKLGEALFQRSLEEQIAELGSLAPLLRFLVEIVQAFARHYRRAKEEKGALDFADLEHYALQILSQPGGGSALHDPRGGNAPGGDSVLNRGNALDGDSTPDRNNSPDRDSATDQENATDWGNVTHQENATVRNNCPDRDNAAGVFLPSAAALKYREQFLEVLVDEYQDINPVQEAILTLVSLPGPEPAGNKFMVGDVKQSIYRFRLAAPELFLEKYRAYTDAVLPGSCLVLTHNFRSRQEILAAVNFLFRQIMDEEVGEMEYKREIWLRYGAVYTEDHQAGGFLDTGGEEEKVESLRAVEALFITRTALETGENAAGIRDGETEQGENAALQEINEEVANGDSLQTGEGIFAETAEEELDRAALEGRLMARRIQELLGAGGSEPYQVFEREKGRMRAATYRDIVILLRAARHQAIPILEELRRAGIPVYAELGTGYFEATEIEVMLSLLKIIDNPYQEIPLAAVLRSPLVGLNAGELARIRAAAPGVNYYEALKVFCAAEKGLAPDPDPDYEQECACNHSCHNDAGFVPFFGGDAGDARERECEHEHDPEHENGPEHEHDPEHENGPDHKRACSYNQNQNHNQNQAQGYDSAGDFASSSSLFARLSLFRQNLQRWREEARQGSLAGLIWQIYRDTGYYDLAGGMPGGNQRQANLRALYDRARQYEATSLRGLFRFLRFIERLKERGGDLGMARALGEQEDVVRIMTIHKSKGLEFPIVFVAGLSKPFNQQDLKKDFLLHKKMGFGPKYVHTALRLIYPTLPWLAVRNRLNLEMLAEEMRILYVALTRAREKLFLVATVKDIAAEVQRWAACSAGGEELLPVYDRRRAKSFLDWLGPALLRHPQAIALRALLEEPGSIPCLDGAESSTWKIGITSAGGVTEGTPGAVRDDARQEKWRAEVARLEKVPPGSGKWTGAIDRQLAWRYPFCAAASSLAKVSVSELQKIFAAGMEKEDAGEAPWLKYSPPGGPRPRFWGERRLTAAERGTAYHTVMQHLKFSLPLDEENICRQLEDLVERELLTVEEKETIIPASIAAFFHTSLGERILRAVRVEREISFSLALPATEVYPDYFDDIRSDRSAGASPGQPGGVFSGDLTGSLYFNALSGDLYPKQSSKADSVYSGEGPVSNKELVLIQGVIDCLAWEEDGVLLVDYKTDWTAGLTEEMLRERYRLQLAYYARALQVIRQVRIKGKYLYFFHNSQVIAVDD